MMSVPPKLILALAGQDAVAAADAAQQILSTEWAAQFPGVAPRLLSVEFELDESKVAATLKRGEVIVRRAEISVEQVREAISEDRPACDVLLRRLAGTPTRVESLPLAPRLDAQAHTMALIPDRVVETARDGRLEQLLTSRSDILMVGSSASGKSVSAALLASKAAGAGRHGAWFDMTLPEVDRALALREIARVPEDAVPLLVIDNYQANPAGAAEILSFLGALRAARVPLQILVATWPSGRQSAEESLPGAELVSATGDEVIAELAARAALTEGATESLATMCQGDVVLCRAGLDFFSREGRIPALVETARLLADDLGVEHLGEEAKALYYWFCCLGMYEIDVASEYASVRGGQVLGELLACRLISRQGLSLAVGHRSKAAMMVAYAQENWSALVAGAPTPPMTAVAYLRGAGDRQVRATLSKLDLVGLVASGDRQGSGFLARAWQSLAVLGAYLARQTLEDATWGDNLASAVFACETLAALDQADGWRRTADYVRSRWGVDELESLPAPIGSDRPAESYDFPEIQKRMAQEDAAVGGRADDMSASGVDLDRFHRTWALGLLLGFEGTAIQRDSARVAHLKRIAAVAQEPDGSFYPSRVPWVTARVVMGLARTGESYESNVTVRRACDWLRSTDPGPYSFGAWSSGTGTWNTEVMTTAMCLTSLGQAGVPLYDPALRAGQAYLKERRNDWGAPGNEIDTAWVLEATLLAGGRWREYSKELLQLLSWAESRSSWAETGVLATESQTESSKVSFIVGGLVGIVWATVKRELPLLLEGASGAWSLMVREAEPIFEEVDSRLWIHLRGQIERLLDVAQTDVNDRRLIVSRSHGGQEVRRQLSIWEERVASLNGLLELAKMDGQPDEALSSMIDKLNQLGVEIEGSAWRDIEVPD